MGVIADVASFGATRAGGKIARGDLEVQAKQEEAAGVQRESDRKERLIEALASQNATAGSRGVAAFEGSPLSIMEEDVRRESVATKRDIFQTELRVKSLRAKGLVAEKQAKSAAAIGLLSAIEGRATAFVSARDAAEKKAKAKAKGG